MRIRDAGLALEDTSGAGQEQVRSGCGDVVRRVMDGIPKTNGKQG